MNDPSALLLSSLYKPGSSPPEIRPVRFSAGALPRPPLNSPPGLIRDTSYIWEEASCFAIKGTLPKGVLIYADPLAFPPIIYVRSGKLCFVYIDEEGNEFISHFVLPRSLCFENSLCIARQIEPMPLKVIEESQVLFFDHRFSLEDYSRINPLLIENMLYSQALKNINYSQLRIINSCPSPLVKTAKFLHAMWSLKKTSRISTGISQKELARILHMHKITFAKAIATLKNRGAIEKLTRTFVTFRDTERLKQIALSSSSY